MKRSLFYAILAVLLSIALCACTTAPITGRSQLSLVSGSEMLSMSQAEYKKFMTTAKPSTRTKDAAMVKRVGSRIQAAVETWYKQNNRAADLKAYSWEFNLVEGKDVNAWCMPGGKVVVYEGLLPVSQDENGLAVVMGHEIAHAVANHGAERMSQQLLVQMGGTALSVAIANKPQQTQSLWLSAYGIGANVGAILPYSRLHESEADRLGLIFMAMAGYDPRTSAAFWQRMAKMKQGAAPPEILSTHPSDTTRINEIQKHMNEALRYYKP